VKFISFEAFVSATVADMDPLHFSVRLSALVDVVTIFWPRMYSGCCDFSASGPAAPDLTASEFFAAYSASAFLWSSEMVWSTAFRVSEESHSGFASQPQRNNRTGKLQRPICGVREYGIVPSVVETLIGTRFEAALFQGKKLAPMRTISPAPLPRCL
jgi:hypothetical protein